VINSAGTRTAATAPFRGWKGCWLRQSVLPRPGPHKMHELSIAQSLVDIACEALDRCEPPPARVQSVLVRVGTLSGVVAEALEFCYELSVEGTPLAGSRLVVEAQPVVVFCPRCLENRVLGDDLRFRCPVCNTPTSELVHGRELELISMELIDHDEPTTELENDRDRKPASSDPGGAPGNPQGQ
jgi:hydrogenase nickel incorporation protein HypA/HybF